MTLFSTNLILASKAMHIHNEKSECLTLAALAAKGMVRLTFLFLCSRRGEICTFLSPLQVQLPFVILHLPFTDAVIVLLRT